MATQTATAPHARTESTLDGVLRALGSTARETGGARPRRVAHRDEHSNEVAEAHFDDGRVLILKRARHYPETAARRLATARHAARLLRERAGVVAPEHLDVPAAEDPVEAYWRIPLPTLQESWPELSGPACEEVLRSWGGLLRRIHGVRLLGMDPRGTVRTTPHFLRTDLKDRLLPAIYGEWCAAAYTTERLIGALPAVATHLDGAAGVLVHGDLHMGNVLCEREGDAVRCVGVIDLEEACAGPPEADWAAMQLLHGPLFCQPLPEGWLGHVADGYGRSLNPVLLAFFRAFRLLNFGLHAAVCGLDEHAEEVAAAAAREVDLLESLLRPRLRITVPA